MAVIHFLNVLEGDCNIIQHDSNRVSVIDISNAYNNDDSAAETKAKDYKEQIEKERRGVPSDKVDFQQKKYPDNPIDYLKKFQIKEVWRFIITHPDMDHLDGMKDFYEGFKPIHTWDTDNNKQIKDTANFAGFNSDDWSFYTQLRDGKYPASKRLALYATQSEQFWKDDFIKILGPTTELCKAANDCGDYNDSSYVLLFTPPKKNGKQWKILFAGDSHDGSWEYILKKHADDVSNVDILFAPHHGRNSNRSYEFLKTVKPRITLFGNASAKHLAYTSYPEIRITNNQAGYVIMDIDENRIALYVKNKEFATAFRKKAKRNWPDSVYEKKFDAYNLGELT
jgi:competence protein ComEC